MASSWAFGTSLKLVHSKKSVKLNRAAFSASGSHLVGFTKTGDLIRWSTDKNNPASGVIATRVSSLNNFTVSADANYVALEDRGTEPVIRIYRFTSENGSPNWTPDREPLPSYQIPSCDHSGRRLAAKQYRSDNLTLIEAMPGVTPKTLSGCLGASRLAFSPEEDDLKLFAGCEDGTICIYHIPQSTRPPDLHPDIDPNLIPTTIRDPKFHPVTCLTVSPQYLAAGGGRGFGIRVWPTNSLENDTVVRWKDRQAFHPRLISFSQCGTWVTSISDEDGYVRVWECQDGSNVLPIFTFDPHPWWKRSRAILAIGFRSTPHSTDIIIADTRHIISYKILTPNN